MLYSKLFIPTLRDDHPLLVKAGYLRRRDYLFLGRRVLSKIVALIRAEFARVDGQEFLAASHASLAAHSREIRGEKQLPQIWYQFNGFTLEAISFGASPFADLTQRILAACAVTESAPVLDPISDHITGPNSDLSPEPFRTPNQKSIADIAAFTGVPATSQMKSVVMMADRKPVLALLRGDHQLDESKLKLALLATDLRPANAAEIQDAFGAAAGSLGPVGLTSVAILCDDALEHRRDLICGANRDDYHLRHVTPARDFDARFFPLRADPHPSISHIATAANFEAQLMTLALDRLLDAAVEQNRDADGIVLPPLIAPFDVIVTPVNISDGAQRAAAREIYAACLASHLDALLDDRDERPGVKFKDSDLIGIPFRITVGKKLPQGLVELVTRRGRISEDIPIPEIVATLALRLASPTQ